jgi:hypothetical protein
MLRGLSRGGGEKGGVGSGEWVVGSREWEVGFLWYTEVILWRVIAVSATSTGRS